MEKMIMIYEEKFSKWGAFIIGVPLILMTIIEVLNVLGRKLYIPFPCSLETVESLMVVSVYLGVSIVALEGGHVNVPLVTQKFPLAAQYLLDAFVNLLGAFTFGLLSVGAWREALKAIGIMEMRIGVYRFPIWPFRLIFALGMTMLAIQVALNTIKFIHRGFGHTDYAARKTEEAEIILQQI
jgi:TRAP-type C4-dicarboxylate transport system permease small subunit